MIAQKSSGKEMVRPSARLFNYANKVDFSKGNYRMHAQLHFTPLKLNVSENATAMGILRLLSRHLVTVIFVVILTPLGLFCATRNDPRAASVILLWAGALEGVGFVFGLLFALPRYGRPEGKSTNTTTDQKALDINTNLLEIADWLTKIIVGLGLIELKQLHIVIAQFSAYVSDGLGSNSTQQFATAIILYFSVTGFLAGYLLTRLELNRLIRAADELYTRPFAPESIESPGSLPLDVVENQATLHDEE